MSLSDAPADGGDDLGGRRLDHRVVVVADHHRQPRAVEVPGSSRSRRPSALSTVWKWNGTLNRVSSSRSSLVARSWSPPTTWNSSKPASWSLAHSARNSLMSAVQILFEHPRLDEVVVGLAERHGLDDRAAHRVVALDQEHPLGERVHLPGARQEVDSRHLGHVVVDDEQGHGLVPVGQPAQGGEPGGDRRLGEDGEVLTEAPARDRRGGRATTPASSSITNRTGCALSRLAAPRTGARCGAPGGTASGPNPPISPSDQPTGRVAGGMFWLMWKKFSGS